MVMAVLDDISNLALAIQHGVNNARQILRDPKELHTDDRIVEACDYLMTHGNSFDYAEAVKVRSAIFRAEVERLANQAEKRSGGANWLILCALASLVIISAMVLA